jgi:RNA polymerase sigma-70 factor (ECF subfamily)
MVNNKMLCEDIVQNVFLKLYENMDLIKNKSSMNFWLFKTARNDIYSYYRSKKVKFDQFYAEDISEINRASADNIEYNFERKELKDLILRELDCLPEEQKDVYLLKEYGGLSYKEIASVLNIDENLVKSRLFKTRQKLINRISKLI